MCDRELPAKRFAKTPCHPSDEDCEELSKQVFEQVTDWHSFCRAWAQFYTGNVAIPTYGATFLGDNSNRHVARKDASKLVHLTEKGAIVIIDSQQGSVDDRQKAYVNAYARDRETAKAIVDEMNRYNGIFAYASRVENKSFDEISAPIIPVTVTYDDHGKGDDTTRLEGDPYSKQVLFTDNDSAMMAFEWINPRVRTAILRKIIYFVTIVDTNFTRKDYLLNTLCAVVNKMF